MMYVTIIVKPCVARGQGRSCKAKGGVPISGSGTIQLLSPELAAQKTSSNVPRISQSHGFQHGFDDLGGPFDASRVSDVTENHLRRFQGAGRGERTQL